MINIMFVLNESNSSIGFVSNKVKEFLLSLDNVQEAKNMDDVDIYITDYFRGCHFKEAPSTTNIFDRPSIKTILIFPVDATFYKQVVVDTFNEFDLIITPSFVGKNILVDNGVDAEIAVIPNFYEDVVFPKKATGKVVFYNESTSMVRKNLQASVDLFVNTFADTIDADKVKLVIKTGTNHKIELNHDYNNLPEIEIIIDYLPVEALHDLWAQADIYLGLAYIEGFGIPLLNMAKQGKPIVTLDSKLSGYMDFLNKKNAYLIKSKLEYGILMDGWTESIVSNLSVVEDCKSEVIADQYEAQKMLRTAYLDFLNGTAKEVHIGPEYSLKEIMPQYADAILNLKNN